MTKQSSPSPVFSVEPPLVSSVLAPPLSRVSCNCNSSVSWNPNLTLTACTRRAEVEYRSWPHLSHHCPFTMIIIAQELRLELEEERKELCPGYKEETKPGPEERTEAEGTEV